jgi:hypothetical protein
MMMRRLTVDHREKLKTTKSRDDRRELEALHDIDIRELDVWLTSIEDDELIAKAARMDLSLDDIPEPDCGPDETPEHWIDDFGSGILCIDSRRALQKAIRERAPAYRKERREMQEFYLKLVLGVGGVITGIGGTIIGIISMLKK